MEPSIHKGGFPSKYKQLDETGIVRIPNQTMMIGCQSNSQSCLF